MTRGQKISIAAILAVPVVMGIIMTAAMNGPASGISHFSSKKIGLVRINDVIYSSEEYVNQLRELREDDGIAGVLLHIDSPGGAVAPSQEIYVEVMKYRKQRKPLVVSIGNLAASGGYYIASPAYRIFANPGSVTGSIGVILSFPHYYKLLDKIGVTIETLKSGDLKDVGNPNREMTPREKAYLQTMLKDIHLQFIEDVSKARSISLDSLVPLADGRIFTGRQALKTGLIDTLGGYEDALGFLQEHLGISKKSGVVEKKRAEPFWKKLLYEEIFDKIPLFKKALSPAGTYFLYDVSINHHF